MKQMLPLPLHSTPQETETAENNGEIAVAEKLKRLKAQAEESDGRNRDLPVGRIHGRRTVQSDACQRKDGQPSGTGMETSQRPIVKCRKQKKYYVHCALSLMRYFAKSGSVNYSWGADALATMHDFVVTMMLYVLYICYAVASVFVVAAALQIYIKMNTGEDGVVKSIVSLVGACLFIIGASIVFPTFFGYRI